MKAKTAVPSEVGSTLVVTLQGDVPTFSFTGEWRGKDIFRVKNLLQRQYLRYQRDARRLTIKEKEDERAD